MGDKTAIEWTDATWNPVTGCSRISRGCDHCYIDRSTPFRVAGRKFDGDGVGSTTGVLLHENRLLQPLKWTRPRKVFVNSLSDMFHDEVPDDFIIRVFAMMALAQHHTFQLLTKRHGRMRSLLSNKRFRQGPSGWLSFEDCVRNVAFNERNNLLTSRGFQSLPNPDDLSWPLPNVWLGVSVEDQSAADLRIPALRQTPAAVRFLSCEPLLGDVTLTSLDTTPNDSTETGAVDWVIVGGESGPKSRPMHPTWAVSLQAQCERHDIAYFFKQYGDWAPVENLDDTHDRAPQPDDLWLPVIGDGITAADADPATVGTLDRPALMRRVGKNTAGRMINGRTHDGLPAAAH